MAYKLAVFEILRDVFCISILVYYISSLFLHSYRVYQGGGHISDFMGFLSKKHTPTHCTCKMWSVQVPHQTILQDFTTTTTNTPRDSLVSCNTLFMYM